MPNRDGTGPRGMGPGTGRGPGRWCQFDFLTNRTSRKRATIFAAVVPLVGALIRDITNPNGVLRFFARKLLGQQKTTDRNKAIKANYTVLSKENTDQENSNP
jgi:hypothetical protein